MASPKMMQAIRRRVKTCRECGTTFTPEVLSSSGGFYVGTRCKCGPFSRESEYYETPVQAQEELEGGDYV